MKKKTGLFGATAALLSFAAPASGATILRTILTNGQEVPPTVPTLVNGDPRRTSFGTARLILNDAQSALTYSINVFNIDFTGLQSPDPNDNLLAAHIHAGAGVTRTTNGPVVFGFFGSPLNDVLPNDVVVTPFTTRVGGMISGKWDLGEGNGTNLSEQLPNVLFGRAYLNFHTTQFPGGEIRGNIPAIPEPATWAMMILGFGLMGAALRSARTREKVRVRLL